ncbi:MAG: aminodeoxychorismate/anthranilate synthase component II [Lysinibacillus sp.]|nr:aminodeoxychorismate/anthranilate synthase component II [Lysinibacillus sp.]
MILLIDNYDSFTYNLYQQIAILGKEVVVYRNDKITIDEIRTLNPEAIVLSPGPGTPFDAGITMDIVKQLYTEFPILGICLGHQSIAAAFGSEIVQAKHIMHGKLSLLNYEQKGLFKDFEEEIEVMRYHSLVIKQDTLHEDLEVLATSKEDGEIMAIQHKNYPLYGLQFHPESIGTPAGTKMVEVFLQQV